MTPWFLLIPRWVLRGLKPLTRTGISPRYDTYNDIPLILSIAQKEMTVQKVQATDFPINTKLYISVGS